MKNRFRRSITLVLAGSLCSYSATLRAALVGIDFAQVNFNGSNFGQDNSRWGTATVHFDNVITPEYFNLSVNGQWVVRNSPVAPTAGPGLPDSVMTNFDLGNLVGTNVTSLNYVASMDASPIAIGPSGAAQSAGVGDRLVTPGGSTDPDAPAAPTNPPAPSSSGGIANVTLHRGVPNQISKPFGCVPTAFSNSLKWLNSTQNAGLPEAKTNIDTIETATGWTAPEMKDGKPVEGTGGPGPNATAGKRALVQPNVATDTYGPGGFITVVQKFKAGADVEVVYGQHMSVITGIIEMNDGTYKLFLQSDLAQDGTTPPSYGDVVTVQPVGPTYTSVDYISLGELKGFIVESVVPEPASAGIVLALGAIFIGRRQQNGRVRSRARGQ
jgi:hypothetical protein